MELALLCLGNLISTNFTAISFLCTRDEDGKYTGSILIFYSLLSISQRGFTDFRVAAKSGRLWLLKVGGFHGLTAGGFRG